MRWCISGGELYAKKYYLDVWEKAVDRQNREFYYRHPKYLKKLPQKYRANLNEQNMGTNWYCRMPLMIKKAEELVGGEEKMDEILRGMYEKRLEYDPYSNPFSILAILFLLSFYYSKKQKSVETLTAQTPVSPGQFLAIRGAVLFICFLLICMLIIGLSVFFYIRFFGFYSFLDFLLPTVLVLPPCFVFALGVGLLAGRIHQALLYFLMLAVFILGVSDIRGFFDFFGKGYFANEPLSLAVDAFGEPAFQISLPFYLARFFYFVGGIMLIMISVRLSGKKARKA